MKKKLFSTLIIAVAVVGTAYLPIRLYLNNEIKQKQEELLDLKGEYVALKSEYDVLSSLIKQAKTKVNNEVSN